MKASKLNAVKFGLAGGIIGAVTVFLITIFSGYFPAWYELFKECYGMFGYSADSILGIILGIAYSFIDGFGLTWIFALVYNSMLK